MDPNANWKEMSECNDGPFPTDEQVDRRKELAQSLQQWLRKGGFPPKITGHQEFDLLVAEATCKEIMQRRG
jgi:hypothetical protein